MSVITTGRTVAPGPCLTTAPWAGRLIGLAFTVTVVLFLVALLTL